MKKFFFIAIAFTMLFATSVSAQSSYNFWKHKSPYRLGYTFQTLEYENGVELEQKMGFNFSKNWSIYLHKKPIADRIKFAIDLGTSANYVKYETNDAWEEAFKDDYEDMIGEGNIPEFGIHQIDLGIAIGPSITVRPFGDWRLNAYFHVTPSASVFINDDEVSTSFVPFLDYGIEASWRWIGVGVEMRQGKGKYKDMTSKIVEDIIPDDVTNNIPDGLLESDEKIKLKTKAVRVYLSIRF